MRLAGPTCLAGDVIGDYSFDVYNTDYLQMPANTIADRAQRAAEWLGETVLRRALPVPNVERLRASTG